MEEGIQGYTGTTRAILRELKQNCLLLYKGTAAVPDSVGFRIMSSALHCHIVVHQQTMTVMPAPRHTCCHRRWCVAEPAVHSGDAAQCFLGNAGEPCCGMLRIWRMSGQELPAVATAGISDVWDVKAELRSLHGFPLCMQQLLHRGQILDNSTTLDGPIDLQLVLLRLSSKVQQIEAANELVTICMQGNLEIARLLLEAGANKDAHDRKGNTALTLAAENGHVEVTQLLLEAGANTDAHDRKGNRALTLAAENGHVEVTRLLLEAGAHKDLKASDGYTALMVAAENGHVEITRLLLEAGANKDERSCNCYTALTLAAKNGHAEITRLLLGAGTDKDEWSCNSHTALMLAAENGHVELTELLLENAACKNERSCAVNISNAIMRAADNGLMEITQLLLQIERSFSYSSHTALMCAAENGDVEIARVLWKLVPTWM